MKQLNLYGGKHDSVSQLTSTSVGLRSVQIRQGEKKVAVME